MIIILIKICFRFILSLILLWRLIQRSIPKWYCTPISREKKRIHLTASLLIHQPAFNIQEVSSCGRNWSSKKKRNLRASIQTYVYFIIAKNSCTLSRDVKGVITVRKWPRDMWIHWKICHALCKLTYTLSLLLNYKVMQKKNVIIVQHPNEILCEHCEYISKLNVFI